MLAQGAPDGLLSQVNKQLLNYVSRGEPAPYKRKAKNKISWYKFDNGGRYEGREEMNN